MKNKIKYQIVLLFLFLLGAFSSIIAQNITYHPADPNVEEAVAFTLNAPPTGTVVNWDFGDGTGTKGVDLHQTTHTYMSVGNFLVTVIYNSPPITVTTTITVTEQRQITYSPPNPKVNEVVSCQAVKFLGLSVRWDFGDGTVITAPKMGGPTNVTHVYQSGGTYTITATDFGGASNFPITTTVTVQGPFISFNPAKPRIGDAVVFNAHNFSSTTLIKWDFGDNTIVNDTSPPSITHIYNQDGTYLVRAYDHGGQAVTASITITVYKQATIGFTPAKPRIGEQVVFTGYDFFSNTLIRWDFGDSTIINDTSPPTVTHVYNQAGTFQVKAYDNGGGTVTAQVSITIYPRASITFSPGDPRRGEPIAFTAHDFFSNNLVRWDFGDGTIENDTSPPTILHEFANTGVFLVRAYDNGGTAVTALVQVSVTPAHLITYSPQEPRVGETVIFRASHFNVSSLQWNFGDNTPRIQGSTQVSHTFEREGIYTVTAYDMRDINPSPLNGGRVRSSQPFAVTTPVTVVPTRGPRAPFSISFVQLRFADGKSYKVVPLGFESLIAYADIKYEGTGIMYLQWLVDGNPFRLKTQNLVQADQTTIDSGRLPGLPTVSPGIHDVTLNVIEPETIYSIPVIRYFVTAEKTDELIGIDLYEATSLDEKESLMQADSIHVPQGEYFLLKGAVINDSVRPTPHLLMRIYQNRVLIDQKLIKNLNPQEERPFETSVKNSLPGNKKLYIVLFDISGDTSDLIFVRELNIVTIDE